MSYPIYLDFNATTPVAPEVIKTISRTLEDGWGNPSSGHCFGRKAKSIIEESRVQIAGMIASRPKDIIFTSGGTEANNMALHSAVHFASIDNILNVRPHVITTNVEHDSVMKILQYWESIGKIDLSIANVNNVDGCLSLETLTALIKPETCLISVMHANNETGIIMPIAEIGNYLDAHNLQRKDGRHRHIYLHCDAAQTIGKVPVDVQELKVDYLTIVGHKFYGPRIGALFVKNLGTEAIAAPFYPLLFGGGQENGHRAGTENTPMIAGLGFAASLVSQHICDYRTNMLKCQEHFANLLQKTGLGFQLNFHKGPRLPNTVSLAVPPSLLASNVLEKFDGRILASLGAACHSGTNSPSAILIASGLSIEEARRTIRFSMGRETTLDQIEEAVEIILNVCRALLK